MPKIGQKIAQNEKMLIQGPVSHRDLARRSLLTSDSDSSPQNWSRVKWTLKKMDFHYFLEFLSNVTVQFCCTYHNMRDNINI